MTQYIALASLPGGDSVIDDTGIALAGRGFYVYEASLAHDSVVQLQLYSDQIGTTLAQPTTADTDGAIIGYIEAETAGEFCDTTSGRRRSFDAVSAVDVATVIAAVVPTALRVTLPDASSIEPVTEIIFAAGEGIIIQGVAGGDPGEIVVTITNTGIGGPGVGKSPPGFVNDTFTDVDGALLTAHVGEVGATWVMHPLSTDANPGIITSNQYRRSEAHVVENRMFASGTPADADYTVTADFVKIGAGDQGFTDLWARLDPADVTGYLLRYNTSPFELELYSVLTGTFTSLGTFSIALPFTATLSVVGTTISAIVNGVAVMSYTDAAVAAAGQVGIGGGTGGGGDATNGVWLDNLVAVD